MINYTCREVGEMQERRDEYQREAMTLIVCIVLLGGLTGGFIFGYLARGWLN